MPSKPQPPPLITRTQQLIYRRLDRIREATADRDALALAHHVEVLRDLAKDHAAEIAGTQRAHEV